MAVRRLLLVTALAASAVGVPSVQADYEECLPTWQNGRVKGACNFGDTGYIIDQPFPPSLPRSVGETATTGARDVAASCMYTAQPEDDNIVLVVRGAGTATGRPRTVLTLITCQVLNHLGDPVFDLTRSESSSIVQLAGSVVIANSGPYTLCASAAALFDDGEYVESPIRCVAP